MGKLNSNYPTLTELVKENYCYFNSVRAGYLYYTISHSPESILNEFTNNTTYLFTVPISEIQGATLHCREKAITLMKWIRAAMDKGELVFYGSYVEPSQVGLAISPAMQDRMKLVDNITEVVNTEMNAVKKNDSLNALNKH